MVSSSMCRIVQNECAMTVGSMLDKFYVDNGIPADGGIDSDTFEMNVFFMHLKLPNPNFRKEMTYIHDMQHILNGCDTSWKGEGFISGYEIGTGYWKQLPINFFIFWAFGYSLWLYPKNVFYGFKKGLNSIGIVDLKISKFDFMKMEFDQLVDITTRSQTVEMKVGQWLQFLLWCMVSQVVLLSPFVSIIVGILWIF